MIEQIEQVRDGVRLHVRVQPRASRSQVVGWLSDGALKVAVASPPVDGEANKACIALLADTFQLPRREIVLVSGDKGRNKVVLVRGLLLSTALAHLPARQNGNT